MRISNRAIYICRITAIRISNRGAPKYPFRVFILSSCLQSSHENGILYSSLFSGRKEFVRTNAYIIVGERVISSVTRKIPQFESRFRRPSTIRRDIVRLLVYRCGKYSYFNFYPAKLARKTIGRVRTSRRDARNFWKFAGSLLRKIIPLI